MNKINIGSSLKAPSMTHKSTVYEKHLIKSAKNERASMSSNEVSERDQIINNYLENNNSIQTDNSDKDSQDVKSPIIPYFNFVINNESDTASEDDSEISNFDMINTLMNENDAKIRKKKENKIPTEKIEQDMTWCNKKLGKLFKVNKQLTGFSEEASSNLTKKDRTEKSNQESVEFRSQTSEYTRVDNAKRKEVRKNERMFATIKEIINIVEDLLKQYNLKEAMVLQLKLKQLLDSLAPEFINKHTKARVLKIRCYYSLFKYSFNNKKYQKALNFLVKAYSDCNYFIQEKLVFKEIIKVLLYLSLMSNILENYSQSQQFASNLQFILEKYFYINSSKNEEGLKLQQSRFFNRNSLEDKPKALKIIGYLFQNYYLLVMNYAYVGEISQAKKYFVNLCLIMTEYLKDNENYYTLVLKCKNIIKGQTELLRKKNKSIDYQIVLGNDESSLKKITIKRDSQIHVTPRNVSNKSSTDNNQKSIKFASSIKPQKKISAGITLAEFSQDLNATFTKKRNSTIAYNNENYITDLPKVVKEKSISLKKEILEESIPTTIIDQTLNYDNPFKVVRKGKKSGNLWDIKKESNAYFFGYNKIAINDTYRTVKISTDQKGKKHGTSLDRKKKSRPMSSSQNTKANDLITVTETIETQSSHFKKKAVIKNRSNEVNKKKNKSAGFTFNNFTNEKMENKGSSGDKKDSVTISLEKEQEQFKDNMKRLLKSGKEDLCMLGNEKSKPKSFYTKNDIYKVKHMTNKTEKTQVDEQLDEELVDEKNDENIQDVCGNYKKKPTALENTIKNMFPIANKVVSFENNVLRLKSELERDDQDNETRRYYNKIYNQIQKRQHDQYMASRKPTGIFQKKRRAQSAIGKINARDKSNNQDQSEQNKSNHFMENRTLNIDRYKKIRKWVELEKTDDIAANVDKHGNIVKKALNFSKFLNTSIPHESPALNNINLINKTNLHQMYSRRPNTAYENLQSQQKSLDYEIITDGPGEIRKQVVSLLQNQKTTKSDIESKNTYSIKNDDLRTIVSKKFSINNITKQGSFRSNTRKTFEKEKSFTSKKYVETDTLKISGFSGSHKPSNKGSRNELYKSRFSKLGTKVDKSSQKNSQRNFDRINTDFDNQSNSRLGSAISRRGLDVFDECLTPERNSSGSRGNYIQKIKQKKLKSSYKKSRISTMVFNEHHSEGISAEDYDMDKKDLTSLLARSLVNLANPNFALTKHSSYKNLNEKSKNNIKKTFMQHSVTYSEDDFVSKSSKSSQTQKDSITDTQKKSYALKKKRSVVNKNDLGKREMKTLFVKYYIFLRTNFVSVLFGNGSPSNKASLYNKYKEKMNFSKHIIKSTNKNNGEIDNMKNSDESIANKNRINEINLKMEKNYPTDNVDARPKPVGSQKFKGGLKKDPSVTRQVRLKEPVLDKDSNEKNQFNEILEKKLVYMVKKFQENICKLCDDFGLLKLLVSFNSNIMNSGVDQFCLLYQSGFRYDSTNDQNSFFIKISQSFYRFISNFEIQIDPTTLLKDFDIQIKLLYAKREDSLRSIKTPKVGSSLPIDYQARPSSGKVDKDTYQMRKISNELSDYQYYNFTDKFSSMEHETTKNDPNKNFSNNKHSNSNSRNQSKLDISNPNVKTSTDEQDINFASELRANISFPWRTIANQIQQQKQSDHICKPMSNYFSSYNKFNVKEYADSAFIILNEINYRLQNEYFLVKNVTGDTQKNYNCYKETIYSVLLQNQWASNSRSEWRKSQRNIKKEVSYSNYFLEMSSVFAFLAINEKTTTVKFDKAELLALNIRHLSEASKDKNMELLLKNTASTINNLPLPNTSDMGENNPKVIRSSVHKKLNIINESHILQNSKRPSIKDPTIINQLIIPKGQSGGIQEQIINYRNLRIYNIAQTNNYSDFYYKQKEIIPGHILIRILQEHNTLFDSNSSIKPKDDDNKISGNISTKNQENKAQTSQTKSNQTTVKITRQSDNDTIQEKNISDKNNRLFCKSFFSLKLKFFQKKCIFMIESSQNFFWLIFLKNV